MPIADDAIQTSQVDAVAFKDVASLYHNGLYQQAYERSKALGPLRAWRGLDAHILGGRLAMRLGDYRLGRAMHYMAWREQPNDPLAMYYYARILMDGAHPLRLLNFIERHPDLPDAPSFIRADWLAHYATVMARMRDFDAAEKLMDDAERLEPERAWLAVEHSYLMRQEDNFEGALSYTRKALAQRPWYTPAISACADCLMTLDRDAEAFELLSEATRHVECKSVYLQMYQIHNEADRFAEARSCLERAMSLELLASEDDKRWYHGRLAYVAYREGDFKNAAEHASKWKDDEFFSDFRKKMETLAAAPDSPRPTFKKLPVPFIRQHQSTCAPATLATIGRFWSLNVDHLEVAEKICYDGTQDFVERRWADTNGFVTREFTGNWADTVALIDRGIPFALTTSEVTSGHLQAVIGYDECRQTLLIRDPGGRPMREYLSEALWKRYRSVGPRCMVLLPKEREALLDRLELKDAELYDLVYELNQALDRHDRDGAKEKLEALNERAPGHLLAMQARRALAGYDSDWSARLSCAEEGLKIFPGDARMLLSKFYCLREMGRRDERLDLLKDICEFRWRKKSEKQESELAAPLQFDPVFLHHYGVELGYDARSSGEAIDLLKRAVRYEPWKGSHYWELAGVYWNCRRFEESLKLHRIATCLDDKSVHHARSYFAAAQHFKRQEEALALMTQRFQRFGKMSGEPATLLHGALVRLGRKGEALAALDAGLALRPDDGYLLLYAADDACNRGALTSAAELLARAETRSKRSAWMQASARLARLQGDMKKALALWQEVSELEPLLIDAHRAVAKLLAETESHAAAVAYLQKTRERFKYHMGLNQLLTDWLRRDQPSEEVAVLKHMLDIDQSDAWIHREMALALLKLGRTAEARASAEESLRLEPNRNFSHSVMGQVLVVENRIAEARSAFKEAIRLSADTEFAIDELLRLSNGPGESKEALEHIHGELVRQTTFGDGWLAYRNHASRWLEQDALLQALRKAWEERPDLWQCWTNLVNHLLEMKRLDEAMDLARKFTDRFPLLIRSWLDLAEVHRARRNNDEWIAALEKATQLDVNWGYSVRTLCDAYMVAGNNQKARAMLEEAVERAPLDAYNHGCLADTLWTMGEKDAALKRMCTALKIEPEYAWGWRKLEQWADELKQRPMLEEFARETTVRRAGSPESWLNLARILNDHADERLAALQKAIELDPFNLDAMDWRAVVLTENKRYDEALAACAAPKGTPQVPLNLRGRKAWVEAERGNLDAAIAMMKEVLADDGDYVWGWRRLAEWSEKKEDFKALLEARLKVVEQAPDDAYSLGDLAHAYTLNQNNAAAKETFRRALEIKPGYEYAICWLFDLYFDDGELESAAKVAALADKHLPASARAKFKRVQFEVRRGNKTEALGAFNAICVLKPSFDWILPDSFKELKSNEWGADALKILEERLAADADYFYGWRQFYDEYESRKEFSRLLEAARNMARLRPELAMAYGYLGEAFKRQKSESDAIGAYNRALELDPKYQFAGRELFDLHLNADRMVQAGEALEKLRVGGEDQFYLLREMKLKMHRGDLDGALSSFERLCADNAAEKWAFDEALKVWPKDNSKAVRAGIAKSLEAAVLKPVVNQHVAPLWFGRCNSGMKSAEALIEKLANDDVRRAFVLAWLDRAPGKLSTTDAVKVTRKYSGLLRGKTRAWGHALYYLMKLNCDKEALALAKDWKDQKGFEPWMTTNLSRLLRRRGFAADANKVNQIGLEVAKTAEEKDDHLIYLAHDALMAGDAEKSAALLKEVQVDKIDRWEKFSYKGVAAMQEFKQGGGGKKWSAFRKLARQLKTARTELLGGNDEVFGGNTLQSTVYKDWLRHVCASQPGALVRFWANYRLFMHFVSNFTVFP